uniref:Uncharacterized protein n=1 Tax=Magallana gigas TaxID=29159 RepID=K1P976_MAGGI
MANYSHFVVYFDVDKSIQTLPKSRLKTEDTDGKVTVLWKTSKMMENGIEVVEDMPYDGTVVFSGSLIKCRAYTNQVNEEIDTTSENALKDLISLGKEMMTAGGKRGASLKLKRAIAAETSDLVIKKSKKEKLCKASNAKNITEKKATESKSKRQTANELKLKEMMAFAVPPATTLTREQDNKKQQKTRTSTPRKLAHSPGPVTNLSHIIGSSFDVLNNENNQFPQYQDVSFQPDEVVGEFGYNNTSTCSTSSFPVQPLIDYYQGLPYEAQTQILSFCHVLTSTLHQYIYGTTLDNVAECSEMSMQRNSAQDGFMSQEVQQLDAKPQAERKLPLIKDADDIYKDVLVNPATLRTAEMKALTAKNPAIYLLNKVLDLVFFEEELRITKGARGLDKHKMDALKGTPATLMDCTHWRKTLVVLGQSGNLL